MENHPREIVSLSASERLKFHCITFVSKGAHHSLLMNVSSASKLLESHKWSWDYVIKMNSLNSSTPQLGFLLNPVNLKFFKLYKTMYFTLQYQS